MSFTSTAKCVLVIGASSGIGKDLALRIHELPSKPTVIIAGRRQTKLDEILAQGSKSGKDNLHALTVDVSSGEAALKSFVDSAFQKFPEVSSTRPTLSIA